MQHKKYIYELKKESMIYKIPMLSYFLAVVSAITIIGSLTVLENPFFIATGLFAGMLILYIAVDIKYKRTNDLRARSILTRLTNLEEKLWQK